MRINHLTLAILIAAAVVLVHADNDDCPSVRYPSVMTSCGILGETLNCFDKCCKRTGRCKSSSCVDVFGTSHDARANCANKCQDEVRCLPAVTGCTGDNSVHCYGFVQCITPACSGHSDGDVCLYDGNSNNFKICDTGSNVVGDPQFMGLRGQSYQVHGVSGNIYNIVSDTDVQYNARFVFLDSGECPTINGHRASGCFTHPGTYLGELGLQTKYGEKVHIKTGDAQNGFASITVNGARLEIGSTVLLSDDLGFVSYNSSHLVEVQIGRWDFIFENSDMYVNQQVKLLDSRHMTAHGMLGQTWQGKVYKNPIKYIEGAVDDYVIEEKHVFGVKFLYNRFKKDKANTQIPQQ